MNCHLRKVMNAMNQNKRLIGVYPSTRKNGDVYYRSSLTYRRKHISLGGFTTAKAAHEAYLTASSLIAEGSDITFSQYSNDSPLAFEKWVCLINFRDNGIYLGTPIYLRPHFFYYYLSLDHVLKFDLDDLFYYSSHKIMCRGNHYFVADYGMQVNIASRYEIKNYAVPGIDYLFLNGDNTDFRRENIEILNFYHGVRKKEKHGRINYNVRIHIRGYYHVGSYSTITEAAIAYNKAIDILAKNGVTKNFTPNYIESLSARQYAEIYSSIKISPSIIKYRP